MVLTFRQHIRFAPVMLSYSICSLCSSCSSCFVCCNFQTLLFVHVLPLLCPSSDHSVGGWWVCVMRLKSPHNTCCHPSCTQSLSSTIRSQVRTKQRMFSVCLVKLSKEICRFSTSNKTKQMRQGISLAFEKTQTNKPYVLCWHRIAANT